MIVGTRHWVQTQHRPCKQVYPERTLAHLPVKADYQHYIRFSVSGSQSCTTTTAFPAGGAKCGCGVKGSKQSIYSSTKAVYLEWQLDKWPCRWKLIEYQNYSSSESSLYQEEGKEKALPMHGNISKRHVTELLSFPLKWWHFTIPETIDVELRLFWKT